MNNLSINSLNSTFYQTGFYNTNKISHSNEKLININTIQNKNNNVINQSRIPLIFQVPKQTSNFNIVSRTPSPPHNRRNIIDLSDNRSFKESSNSPVVYRKLDGIDSFINLVQINPNPVRNMSPQPVNLRISGNNFVKPNNQIPQSYINIEQKIHRLARTPEPRKNHFDDNKPKNHQFHNSFYINNMNNMNINNLNNMNMNNLNNMKFNYSFLKDNQNKQSMKINHNRIVSEIPHINNYKNDYLKLHNNINIKKINDYFQNNNFVNNINIKKINDSNQFSQHSKESSLNLEQINNINQYNNNGNRISIKKLSFFNQNNNYENRINIKKFPGFNQNSNLVIKKLNDSNYRNYVNNMNVKKINDSNQNHNFLNDININQNNNNNFFLNNINNININQSKNNINNISIKKITHNSQNSSLNNNYVKISNDSYSNYYNNSGKNLPNLNSIGIQNNIHNIPPNVEQNHINIIPMPQKKFHFSENGIIRRSFKENDMINLEPKEDFNLSEFKIIKQIGEGTFGVIYCVKWIKNNKLYALKEIGLYGEELDSFKKKVKIVQNLVKQTGHNGFIKIYGDKSIPQKKPHEYLYYILMELGERDWEVELKIRKTYNLFYSEYELLQVIFQIVKTLTLMQRHNVTHRDIKPQNILLCKGVYKLCDFDEAKLINGNGPILQPVRGSELYMSPILFYAYNGQVPNVLHNTYKSDVFSLGMSIFLAATLSMKPLCEIRELKDMNVVSNIINNELKIRYSQNIINLVVKMLQIDENLRFDFIELEEYINNIWPNKEFLCN